MNSTMSRIMIQVPRNTPYILYITYLKTTNMLHEQYKQNGSIYSSGIVAICESKLEQSYVLNVTNYANYSNCLCCVTGKFGYLHIWLTMTVMNM